eukprot:CAMPEP_0119420572 /NCGR_PEP_ID=MMETSP1335-20130426/23827_1 /TAXON_ID=259385 /ORGANISM="Chrysoculter rhomboideus, Strain RCC1486" /LENGTH=32 /DNA_ID= /DNA_START= /DNA_END= /DNA_ORIENTATION=
MAGCAANLPRETAGSRKTHGEPLSGSDGVGYL